MKYSLFIDEKLLLVGDVYIVLAALLVVVLLVIFLVRYVRRRLRETDVLKYEFITIIAHKFRTPLSQIKWITEEMFQGETDPYKKQGVGNIKQSNEKLIKLTNTLLELTDPGDLSKTSYNVETIDLCEMVRRVSDAYKGIFHEKNIFFSVQCPVEEISVKADRARFEFIFETVLENAASYTRPGQRVDVFVNGTRRHGIITVEDHGIGIEPGDMPHIFKTKFYRSDMARSMDTEGIGVGLYLASSIMRRLRGKIEAYSAGKNKGATFTLTLPRL